MRCDAAERAERAGALGAKGWRVVRAHDAAVSEGGASADEAVRTDPDALPHAQQISRGDIVGVGARRHVIRRKKIWTFR